MIILSSFWETFDYFCITRFYQVLSTFFSLRLKVLFIPINVNVRVVELVYESSCWTMIKL